MIFRFPVAFNIPELEIYPYNFIDLFNAIRTIYPEYSSLIIENMSNGYDFNLTDNSDPNNPRQITPYELENCKNINDIDILELEMFVIGSGSNLGKIGLGVGLLALGLSGVGLLGISATTLTLTGASLLFSSLFKHPKTNNSNKDSKPDKRSVNFSGVINVTGGGVVCPLAFGQVSIGSIVASAQIVPYDAPVN